MLSAVLGEDRVAQYHLTADGKLAANGDLPLPQGTGPRHIAFSPAAAPHPRAFVADEGNGTVQAVMTVAAYDPAAGTLRAEAQLSTIADGVNASGMYPSEIAATPDGRWVLVSVRDATSAGRDSVAVFEVGAAGVKAAAYVNAAGHYPRSMAFSRSYTQLVVGNQKSNSVATFAFDVAAGRLTYSGHNITVPDAPAFVYVV